MLNIAKFSNAILLVLEHRVAANHAPVTLDDVKALKYIVTALKQEPKLPPLFVMNQEAFIDSIINIDHKIERGKPQKTRSSFGLKLRSAKKYEKLANIFLQFCNDFLKINGIEKLFDKEVQQTMMKRTRLDQAVQTKLLGKPVIIYEKLPDFGDDDDNDNDNDNDTVKPPEIIYEQIPNFAQPSAVNSNQPISEKQESRLRFLAGIKDPEQPGFFTSQTDTLSVFKKLIISQQQLHELDIVPAQLITYLMPSEFFLVQSETNANKVVLIVQNESGEGYTAKIFDEEGFDENDEYIENHLEKFADELDMECCSPVSLEQLKVKIQMNAEYAANPLTL